MPKPLDTLLILSYNINKATKIVAENRRKRDQDMASKHGLTGSEAQITWADQIVDTMQPLYALKFQDAMKSPLLREHPEYRTKKQECYEQAWLNAPAEASWWIQHRSTADNILANQANETFYSWYKAQQEVK